MVFVYDSIKKAGTIMLTYIKNFFNGMAFGITETIPGVSGGTIAIIQGFYDKLISHINNFRKDFKNSLKFLIPIGLGAVTGLMAFATLINFLLEKYSFPTMSFFIGLIMGIIPLIFWKVRQPGRMFKLSEIVLVVVPIALLVVMSHLNTISVTDPDKVIREMGFPFMLFIFFVGIVAAMALVIPGVSGSFVMLLMGIYPLVTHSVASIKDYLTNMKDIEMLLNICKVLVPLAIGVIIGGLAMVRLIERLLKNHHQVVYLIILGLLIGSVYSLFNNSEVVFKSETSPLIIGIGIATLLLGCTASFFLGKKKL